LINIETDEVARINRRLSAVGARSIEAWVGVTASSRKETLANIECALEAGADALVIAPLSISNLPDVVAFFQRDVSDLFDRRGSTAPVFLYDNADIAVNPRVPHIHTRDVKRLSRLPFVCGIKVSASRRVLGNYTKGALHFKDKGAFGVYVGNAMLIFQLFHFDDGPLGLLREYWNRYLLHDELPIGVVSGPANLFPREWQRAWRACYAGNEQLIPIYEKSFAEFSHACVFGRGGKLVDKMIACLKYGLKLDGVIESDLVAEGTPALTATERTQFASAVLRIRRTLESRTDSLWVSQKDSDR
jgi:dihydrodipicolinate synthase/N-acetylneuraminate lyase